YKRHLKFDLLAAQRGRGGGGRDPGKRPRPLLYRFNQGPAVPRSLSRLTPQTPRPPHPARPAAATRPPTRRALADLRKLAFERFRNSDVQRAPPLAQQRAIGRVLHQRMLEQIRRVWR